MRKIRAYWNLEFALSLAIKKLEQEMSCELLVKSSSGIKLTQQGQMLYAQTLKATQSLQNAIRRTRHPNSKAVLRIGSVPQFVNEYLLKYFDLPENNLILPQIYSGFSYVTHQNVIRGNFDFGFISWSHKPDEIQSFKIKREPLLVAGLKDKFPEISKAQTMKDLELLPMIWLPKLHRDPNAYFTPHRRGFVVQEYFAFRHLILNGFGIGEIQTDFFSKDELKKLAFAPFTAPREGVDVYLIFKRDIDPFVQKVIEDLRAYLEATIRPAK